MAENRRYSQRMPIEMSQKFEYFHKELNMTYDDMAEYLGMSKSFFCKIRHFDKGVPDKYWPALYKLLNELSKKQKETEE